MKFNKITSLVMALILVGSVFTIPVKAVENNNSDTTLGYEIDSETGEVLSLRDEYTQAFLNRDGNIDVCQFSVPINYYNSNEELVQIDNSILPNTDVTEDFALTNAANDIKVYLSDSSTDTYVAKLKYHSMALSVKPVLAGNSTAQILDESTVYEYDTGAGNLFSNETAVYSGFYSNTDYAITVTNLGMRQNLILKNSNAANYYMFELKLDNLLLANDAIVTAANGTITLSNRLNEAVYKIFNPRAKDANGNIIDSSITVLQNNSRDTITFRIGIDSEYLESSECEYPVTVTNTYYTNKSVGTRMYNPIIDLYTHPSRVSANIVFDGYDYLAINAAGTQKIYLKFNKSTITGHVSTSQLCLTEDTNTAVQSGYRIYTWGTEDDWNATTLQYVNPDLLYPAVHVDAIGTGVYSTDVTDFINTLRLQSSSPMGFCMRYVPSSDLPSTGATSFYSAEYGNIYLAPYLMYTLS